MKHRHFSIVLLLVFALVLIIAACAPGATPQAQKEPANVRAEAKIPSLGPWETLVVAARKEGAVVIYGSVIGDARDPLVQEFKNKYGIGLEFLQGRGGEIVEKLLTERKAGLYQGDMGIGGLTTFFSTLKPANVPIPLEPLIVSDEVKDATKWRLGKLPFVDKDRTVLALASIAALCVNINTAMVQETELSSFDDLLAPKWKGKVVINDPSLSGFGNDWFSFMLINAYGREKGAQYMNSLKLQDPVIMRDERLQVEAVAKGKYPVILGAKPTVVQTFINAGAPIKSIKVKEGAPVTSGALNLYAFDRGPHPNATKLFINWLLSKEGSEIINRTTGYATERADVSKKDFDQTLVPGPKDPLQDEEYVLAKAEMQKVAAGIFKDLLK